ncbi:MAG TPA: PEP-CTERM sorting domain-containing protein [Fimbriimonadaceae bacterium]|nr:PEP-CTERM sorting domain-containing protein [Fimbriimonadaceae bacterium]
MNLQSHVNLAVGDFHGYAEIYHTTSSPIAAFGADMIDYLTLQGPGTAAIPVTMTLHVDGKYIYDQNLTLQQNIDMKTDRFLTFGTGKREFTADYNRSNNGTQGDYFTFTPTGTVIQTTVTKDFIDVTLEVTQMMSPGDSLRFEGNVNGQCTTQFGAACAEDYMNTGQMGVVLPQGYSFTSYSGVFLTAAPEPAPFVLFGLGVVALILRRRA